MKYIRNNIIAILSIVISTIVIILLWSKIPDQIPTHWNFRGDADRFGLKWPNAFLGSIIGTGILIMFEVLPHIDPKKDNYKRFNRAYNIMKSGTVAFLCLVGLIPILTSTGILSGKNNPVISVVGLLIAFMGNYMGQVKQNWYAGIKTPWTLSNEVVWNKTHRFAGKLWLIAGICGFIGGFIPGQIGPIIFAVAMTASGVIPVIYSYVVFRQER
jgi:uncharacterized membrane protein